jgi:hypothetical protein
LDVALFFFCIFASSTNISPSSSCAGT